MVSSAKERLAFWGYPWIQPFLDIFKKAEELDRKMILNISEQVVIRKSKVLEIKRME